jgi:hypothetical protein
VKYAADAPCSVADEAEPKVVRVLASLSHHPQAVQSPSLYGLQGESLGGVDVDQKVSHLRRAEHRVAAERAAG